MRQAGLVSAGVALLGDIPVGTTDLGPVPIHHAAHHHRPARRRGLMHYRFGGAENSMVGVAILDPNAGLVGRHHRGLAQLAHGGLPPWPIATPNRPANAASSHS